MNKPSTFLDDNAGVDLEPSRTRLLFKAVLSHGPGFSESVEYRVGGSQCGGFDVLWQSADWVDEDDGPRLQALAWMPRHAMKGKGLFLALLQALFEASKRHQQADGPNFEEIVRGGKGLLTSGEVWEVAEAVFRGPKNTPKRHE